MYQKGECLELILKNVATNFLAGKHCIMMEEVECPKDTSGIPQMLDTYEDVELMVGYQGKSERKYTY